VTWELNDDFGCFLKEKL